MSHAEDGAANRPQCNGVGSSELLAAFNTMNKEKAKEVLKDCIQPDGGLFCLVHYLSWRPGEDNVTIDCDLGLEELEAIVWWMRNSANVAGEPRRHE